MSRAKVGAKFLVYGLVLGILFAPRSGDETRAMLMQRVREIIDELTGRASDSTEDGQS